MLTQEKQVEMLRGLNEGDVIEYGALFKFAPDEKLAWRCLAIEEVEPGVFRYTFHVYFMDIMLKAAQVRLNADGAVHWGQS